jgi:hypothetical protein
VRRGCKRIIRIGVSIEREQKWGRKRKRRLKEHKLKTKRMIHLK